MTEYKIIKNTPEPASRDKYPFRVMEVGDAFDAPISKKSKIQSAATRFGKRNGVKFSVRKLDENTIRCRRMS